MVRLVAFGRRLCTRGGPSCPASERVERSICTPRHRANGAALHLPRPKPSVGSVEYGRPQHAPDIIVLAASGVDVSVGRSSQCTFRNDQRKTGLTCRARIFTPVGGPAPFSST